MIRGALPKDCRKRYPGVELKKFKGFVVCPGSLHPSGRTYDVVAWQKSTPDVPDKLLATLLRPKFTEEFTDCDFVAKLTGDELRTLLELLDVTEFAENEAWLNLGMACVSAAGNDGKDEYLHWSMGDVRYADEKDVVWNRIDSWTPKGRVTYRTLRDALVKAGHGPHPLVSKLRDENEAVADFEGQEFDLGNSAEDGDNLDAIQRLNRRYAYIENDARVVEWVTDPSFTADSDEAGQCFQS